jgi:hypothetical protein
VLLSGVYSKQTELGSVEVHSTAGQCVYAEIPSNQEKITIKIIFISNFLLKRLNKAEKRSITADTFKKKLCKFDSEFHKSEKFGKAYSTSLGLIRC